jgi:hypothetical protein
VTTILSCHEEGGDGGIRFSALVLSPLFLSGEKANIDITIPMVMHNISRQIILDFITFFLDY